MGYDRLKRHISRHSEYVSPMYYKGKHTYMYDGIGEPIHHNGGQR